MISTSEVSPEVLVGEQFSLRDLQEIPQRPDLHLLEAVPGANTQFEVGHGSVKERTTLGEVAILFLVVVHVLGGDDVLHEQACTCIVRRGVEDLPQATLRRVDVTAVLVDHGEVDHRVDRRKCVTRVHDSFVAGKGLVLFTMLVEQPSQTKRRLRPITEFDRLAIRGDRTESIASLLAGAPFGRTCVRCSGIRRLDCATDHRIETFTRIRHG